MIDVKEHPVDFDKAVEALLHSALMSRADHLQMIVNGAEYTLTLQLDKNVEDESEE